MQTRFIYSSSAVAAGANFSGPDGLRQSFAACSLPFVGGRAYVTENGPGGGGVLTFAKAETEITGRDNGQNQVVTTARTTVTGLKILGKLDAKKVEVSITLTFDVASRKLVKVDIGRKPYDGLVIDGADYSWMELETDLADKAGKDHAGFRKHDLPARRPGKYWVHANGKAFTSLAKDDARLKFTDVEHAYVDVAGLGRVYFAEWAEREGWQSITGLRVELTGQYKGSIVIADPDGEGQFYP